MSPRAKSTAHILMAAGLVFWAGWVSSAGYFRVKHLWNNQHKLIAVETTVVPKLKTQVRQLSCDRTKLAQVAQQAVAANEGAPVDAPDATDIHGCPKVAPVKAPSPAAVIKN